MNKETAKKRTRRLNAMDYFLIAALFFCLAGAALRMVLGSDSGSFTSQAVMEEYVLSYKIKNIRQSSTAYLRQGEKFYMDANEKPFGVLVGDISVMPTEYDLTDAEGNYVVAHAPENGDATRIDVTGTMQVTGYMGEGGFLLDGTTSVAVNKAFALRSSHIYVTITVTDIVKAS